MVFCTKFKTGFHSIDFLGEKYKELSCPYLSIDFRKNVNVKLISQVKKAKLMAEVYAIWYTLK